MTPPMKKTKQCIMKTEKKQVKSLSMKKEPIRKTFWKKQKNITMNIKHQLYKKINTLKGGYKKYEKFLVKEDGTLITARSNIVERLKTYFEHRLNCNDPIENLTWTRTEPNLNEYTVPSKQEVKLQIRRLKNYKSPSEDGIQGEIMKMLDEDSLTHIHRLLTHIWEQEVLPEGWNVAVVCPIHKKCDPQICNNYRGIALLNVVYKILYD
jgi:hypothetical protein